MYTPLVSVIVPVYKVEPFLEKCVHSITSQTYSRIEIILVDDGSPDLCPTMCDNLAKTDNRIKVIHQENKGLPKAREAGYQQSKGDFIFFLDSDDYIAKNCIEILIEHYNKSQADIIVSGIYLSTESGLSTIERCASGLYTRENIDNLLSTDYLHNNITKKASFPQYAWGKLINRKVMDGYFDVSTQFRYWEDMPSTFFLMKKIKTLEIIEDNLYYYVIHPNQVTQKPIKKIWHYYVDVWNYFEKEDDQGYLEKQLPQRIWWTAYNGLVDSIKKQANYKEFKDLFFLIKKTPIAKKLTEDINKLELNAPTYKLLHFFYKSNLPYLFYLYVKTDIAGKIKKIIRK